MATAFGLNKIRREDLANEENLCEYCTAKCCRYFALPIETPEDFADLEYIRWYLLHERASVFKDEEDWYLLVHTVCKHLQDDNRCGIYETRPQICRDYTTKNCEYEENWTYECGFGVFSQIRQLDIRDYMLGKRNTNHKEHEGHKESIKSGSCPLCSSCSLWFNCFSPANPLFFRAIAGR